MALRIRGSTFEEMGQMREFQEKYILQIKARTPHNFGHFESALLPWYWSHTGSWRVGQAEPSPLSSSCLHHWMVTRALFYFDPSRIFLSFSQLWNSAIFEPENKFFPAIWQNQSHMVRTVVTPNKAKIALFIQNSRANGSKWVNVAKRGKIAFFDPISEKFWLPYLS